MPDVSEAVDKASNLFLEKVDNMKKKIQDFTSTSEWQNADFFGKVSISWDNLIAEPFGQWWDSTGKPFFTDKARGIGEGKGITNGLLVLLGFDIQSAAEDGISIGTSFAEGFSKGFIYHFN